MNIQCDLRDMSFTLAFAARHKHFGLKDNSSERPLTDANTIQNVIGYHSLRGALLIGAPEAVDMLTVVVLGISFRQRCRIDKRL